ncbi:hypothetical protein D9M70_519010 [compost metagenome]
MGDQCRHAIDQIVGAHLGELIGDAEHRPAQLGCLEQRGQQVGATHTVIGERQRGIDPGPLDG